LEENLTELIWMARTIKIIVVRLNIYNNFNMNKKKYNTKTINTFNTLRLQYEYMYIFKHEQAYG